LLNDYFAASFNAIVQTAGISKGGLFYYFQSKEELYHFLCDYVFEIVKNEYVVCGRLWKQLDTAFRMD
jgi:AcrR family transcriptional regulator